MRAEAHRERQLARLVIEEAERRMGVEPDDRLRPLLGDLLDLDAALRRADEEDPAGRPIQDRR